MGIKKQSQRPTFSANVKYFKTIFTIHLMNNITKCYSMKNSKKIYEIIVIT